MLSYATYPCFQ